MAKTIKVTKTPDIWIIHSEDTGKYKVVTYTPNPNKTNFYANAKKFVEEKQEMASDQYRADTFAPYIAKKTK